MLSTFLCFINFEVWKKQLKKDVLWTLKVLRCLSAVFSLTVTLGEEEIQLFEKLNLL